MNHEKVRVGLKVKDSGEKLPKDLENPDLLSLLKRFLDVYEKNSQEAAQSAAKAARLNNQKMQHAFAGLAVSILLGLSGFLLSKYFEESRHKREDAQAEIQRKLKKLEDISIALTEIRLVKDDVLLTCGDDSVDKRGVEHKRLDARTNVIKAVRNADFYFGKDVYSEITSFVEWESSINDYCSKDLPNDTVWRDRHRKIETLIREYFPKEIFIHGSAQ